MRQSANPQPGNGRVIEEFSDFLGSVWDQTQLPRVNDRSENGRNKMSGIVGIRYRFTPKTIGFANHPAAIDAATVDHERRKTWPVITTTAFVKLGGTAHLTAADKHDLVR